MKIYMAFDSLEKLYFSKFHTLKIKLLQPDDHLGFV